MVLWQKGQWPVAASMFDFVTEYENGRKNIKRAAFLRTEGLYFSQMTDGPRVGTLEFGRRKGQRVAL